MFVNSFSILFQENVICEVSASLSRPERVKDLNKHKQPVRGRLEDMMR